MESTKVYHRCSLPIPFFGIVLLSVLLMGAGHPDSYLLKVERTLQACRSDVPAMVPLAEAAAERLVGGGHLWATGQRSMVSELCGRAGGLMAIDPLPEDGPADDDVVLFIPESGEPVPESLVESKALVVVIGGTLEGRPSLSNHAEECAVSPTLANAIPGWLFTGELISALTRRGKMPVVYESIGSYGGFSRIQQYRGNGIDYHVEHEVPPIPPGEIANAYVNRVSAMLRRVEEEQCEQLERVGSWVREAKKEGKRTLMYSMGHLFPAEVERTDIGTLFESAVWNAGFLSWKPPDHDHAEGDVLVHIGYQHPPLRLLERAFPKGAKTAYVSVRPHRDYPSGERVVWIDPMWSWPDACVPIEGYDIPALPASGVINGAIAWEIYRLSTQQP
jgi:hypothetical protein